MTTTASAKSKFRLILSVTLVGMVIGTLFATIAFGYYLHTLVKGCIAGFIIAFFGGIFEQFIASNKLRKLPFSALLAVKTIFYVLLISFASMLVWVVHESSLNNATLLQTIRSDDFRHFILEGDFKYILAFSIPVVFLINFFVQMNFLLGRGVLLNYITGKYHRPVSEERIIMFLDLESSTTIAEKIGMLEYHRFMNNYFFDINEPIIECKGEIYQYVGDEIVISWTPRNGIRNSTCIECFFKIGDKIKSKSDFYRKEFGCVPGFKAGLHFGSVVIGEVGVSKKEIAFHGDTMNTAARIQGQAKTLNKPLLLSKDLLRILRLDSKYQTEEIGTFKLKGKEQELSLYSIIKK